MNKVIASADQAVADIHDGATIVFGGFGLCGIAENLTAALVRRGVKNLHTIANNVGIDGYGTGRLLEAGQISSHTGSYVGENKLLEKMVLAGMMVYYHLPVTRYVLYLIPIMAVLTAFGLALALFLSVLQVRMRDIGLAMPLLMQVWMFATPVVYPLSAVPSRLRFYYDLNPLAGTIESFRRVLLQSKPPEYSSFAEATVIAVVLLPLAYLFFKNREASMADHI